MEPRNKTQEVRIGNLMIGADHPIAIQSMTNTHTKDVAETLQQIRELAEAGCELVRVTVPDSKAAEAFATIKQESPLPMVADIHFDYRLALAAIEGGADKIRINPGNIGGTDKVKEIIVAARKRGIPIRIGANSGSTDKDQVNLIVEYCDFLKSRALPIWYCR